MEDKILIDSAIKHIIKKQNSAKSYFLRYFSLSFEKFYVDLHTTKSRLVNICLMKMKKQRFLVEESDKNLTKGLREGEKEISTRNRVRSRRTSSYCRFKC